MTIYVFDSGPFINLFNHYYPGRFPTLWGQFEDIVKEGRLTSTREVRRELENRGDRLSEWCAQSGHVFPISSAEELTVVSQIFAVAHFQAMIRKKEILEGKPVADPFVIARAKCLADGCVVTTEVNSPNAAKIPNVCDHFGIEWTNLEGFMEREEWRF